MRILESLKRWRELLRLRLGVRRAPSPAAYGALAERHLAHGRLDLALAVAEEGLAVFPDSERLAQVRLFAKKQDLSGRIRRLRQDVVRRPSPTAYANLAHLYRELGDEEGALEMAAECAERFPLNEQPHLIQGEIRLQRFLRDQVAKDAVLAEAALAKVTRINAHSVKAHLLLAELHHAVGAAGACRRHLRAVLTASPGARDVQDFLRVLGAADTKEPGEELEFAERAALVESEGEFPRDPDVFPSALPRPVGGRGARGRPVAVDAEALRRTIDELGLLPGISNVAVVDREGTALAESSSAAGLPRRAFADLVVRIRETADDASRRMDTGALVRAEIETPTGNVTVVRVRSFTVGALYSDALRADGVWEMLQDVVARHLSGPAEVARA